MDWRGRTFCSYAVQFYSPLRINTHACMIFRLTAIITDSKIYLIDNARPLFPIGVPFTFSIMARINLANSFGFGLFNLICMFIAAYAGWVIAVELEMRRAAPTIILLSFSSFPLIKSSLLALTDTPYFARSLLCVASLEILRRKGG